MPMSGGVGPVVFVEVYSDTPQTILNADYTPIIFNSARYDAYNFHESIINPERVTIPTGYAGMYVVNIGLGWESDAGNVFYYYVMVNDTQALAIVRRQASGQQAESFAFVKYLQEGDYITVEVYQDSGGELDILAGEYASPEFRMVKVG